MGERMTYTPTSKTIQRFVLIMAIMLLAIGLFAQTAANSKLTTKVSYNADDATLSSVLNALSRQSGTNIVLAVDPGAGEKREERRVTINIKDVPIDTAVSLVARATGLYYKVLGDNAFIVGS